jgi:uncharacterized protein (TIGR00297 family)
MQAGLGAFLAAIIASLAYRARALSSSGAVMAFFIGAIVFASGGWAAASVLFAFFLPSALLSRVGIARKRFIAGGEREAPRNGWQVLANGGVAALCALVGARGGGPLAAAFAGAFAAASADTWGTEIGTLSRRAPVSILTLRPLRTGLSGGITPLGIAATAAGSLCVACIASLVGIAPLWSVALGGIAGATLDSMLGASLQALRWCPRCASECETRRHRCGAATVLRRGLSWIGNDAINFAATLCGAIVALVAVSF